MRSLARPLKLPLLLFAGLLPCLPALPAEAANQKKRPSPQPASSIDPPAASNKSKLTGDKVMLAWDDFNRLESPPGGRQKSAEIHSLAYTLASYRMASLHEWRQASPVAPRIWRISSVTMEIALQDDRSWVRASLFPVDNDSAAEKAHKQDVLTRLLQHEQGHYDIVATIARDLQHDLLALQEFNSEAELKRKVDELKSIADQQIETLNRKYDEQCGLIDRQRENQARWNKLLARAKEGKRLTSLFAEPASK